MNIESGHLEIELIAHGFGKREKKMEEKTTREKSTQMTTRITGSERYKKEKRIGEGGEGSVFLAIDKVTGNRIALKKLKCFNMEEVQKAKEEALPITMLDHPHIVKYEDIYEEGSEENGTIGVCLVMKYFEKGDLAKYLRLRKKNKKRATFERAVKFSLQITEAVRYLHSKRIMHRDLKPENIFMSNDFNTVYLGDFGFKRHMEHSSASTVLGTLGYLAPEVAAQQKYSWKADIYSLGCVMYEIITLNLGINHNFQALSRKEQYFNEIKSEIMEAYHNQALTDLIVRMLDTKPDERPTAEQVVMELREILKRSCEQKD